jgi:putative flippase GtrA
MAFYRFCRWGGFGFVADGIVLLTLIYVFDVHPLLSRIFSFGIAVALTFQLNRSWTFSSLRQQHLSSAFAAYVAVQGVGFVCNLTIYTFALLVFHLPTASLLCLALASAVGLFLTTWVPSG